MRIGILFLCIFSFASLRAQDNNSLVKLSLEGGYESFTNRGTVFGKVNVSAEYLCNTDSLDYFFKLSSDFKYNQTPLSLSEIETAVLANPGEDSLLRLQFIYQYDLQSGHTVRPSVEYRHDLTGFLTVKSSYTYYHFFITSNQSYLAADIHRILLGINYDWDSMFYIDNEISYQYLNYPYFSTGIRNHLLGDTVRLIFEPVWDLALEIGYTFNLLQNDLALPDFRYAPYYQYNDSMLHQADIKASWQYSVQGGITVNAWGASAPLTRTNASEWFYGASLVFDYFPDSSWKLELPLEYRVSGGSLYNPYEEWRVSTRISLFI